MLGTHLIRHWCVQQQTLALSSGEAEYAAIVKASAAALGVRSILEDLGWKSMHIDLNTDASAGKAIATRRGLGKVRHLALHHLWVQQRVQDGEISVHKVHTSVNPADLMTKHHDQGRMRDLMRRLHVRMCETG